MSIEKITSKILSEAEAVKAQTLDDAKQKSDAVIAEAKKTAEEMVKSSEENGRIEKEKVISRRKSVAEIDSRKVILAKKQELINDCFEKAIDSITAMDQASYIDLLVNLGKSTGLKEGKLIFNEKERDAIGDKVVENLNKAIEGAKFILSEETRNIRGGYMLMTGMTFINNTVEALVEDKKEEMVGEVAKMLFPA